MRGVTSGARNGMENTWYNYTQHYVLRLMNVMRNEIHIHKFHPETFSRGKPLVNLAHAD